MHFTVQFLGEVSEEMIGKISDALNSIEFSCIFNKFFEHWSFSQTKFPTGNLDWN